MLEPVRMHRSNPRPARKAVVFCQRPFALIRAGLTAAALMLTASALSAQPAGDGLDYEGLADAVDDLEQRLGRLRGEVDQTRFDVEELVFELNFDADEIVDFVRTGIAFHPYEGLLRGMRGTLMSRAGNSLDQALLLAFMLKSSGADARVVRGELDDRAVEVLLRSVSTADNPEDELAGLDAAVEKIFGPRASAPEEQIDWKNTELRKQSERTVSTLQKRLVAQEFKFASGPMLTEIRDAVGPYFWVEYRTGPGDDWRDAHPVFSPEDRPEVQPKGYMAEQVDDRFHHTVTVEAWIRQRQGDSYQDFRLMSPWTRPAANLHGVTISYRNHPGSISPATLANLDQTLDDDEILTPVFRGGPAPGAMAFDLEGRLVDPMALGSGSFGAAGLFSELSDKMQSAAESVEAREDGRPAFALDAMWLEFTLTTPAGRETSYRRYVLAPGADRAPLADKLWPLLTEHVYVVNTGSLPLDYLADRYLAAGAASMDLYKALAHKLLRPGEGTPLPRADIPQDFGPLSMYRLMDANPMAAGTIAVRHVPAIVGIRNGLRGVGTAFTAVDIVENRMLQLSQGPDGLRHDPQAALRRGVWDTAIEVVPARIRQDAKARVTNTFEVLTRARSQGIGLKLVRAGDELPPGISEGAARMLKHDLDNGFAVLVPESTPEGTAMTAWWRVDPISGTTLGMTADGYGQSVTEYLIEMTGIAFNLFQAVAGLKKCEQESDTVVRMCCLVEAHINNVAGLGFGSTLGATVGTVGATVFDIVNFGMQEATGAVFGEKNAKGLMPQAKLSCKKMAGSGF